MHNTPFDTTYLEVNGAPVKRWLVHDTRAMAHLLSPAERTGLKPRAAKVLGPWALHGEDELKLAMAKGGWGWDTVPVELLWKYAAFDTVITAQLAEEQYPYVARDYGPLYELELAVAQVYMDMGRRGILIDRPYLERGMEEWGRERAAVEHVLNREWHIANPNSDQQVMRAMEREFGWRPLVFTEKGNPKLDDDILGAIDHPVPQLVLRHREFHKLINTYGRNILRRMSPDGRVHPSINPLGARTGRSSVSDPSLQNLPAGDARIRNAFVVGAGNVMAKADYDQVEGRLFAHYSGDRAMIESIRYGDAMTAAGHEGYDLHSVAARMVFGIGMDQPVPKPARKRAKGAQFSKIYGSGLETFAATAGLTLSEAQSVMDTYERTFPESRKDRFPSRIAQKLVERDRATGDPHVVTAYGRKEPCWPSQAYKAVNYLIQGTAADVLKAKLVELSRTWMGDHLLLPVHDEVLTEVPEEAQWDAVETLRRVMPETERFAVPLTVDTSVVRRWGDGYDQ
jgi:DNA polymerase-1